LRVILFREDHLPQVLSNISTFDQNSILKPFLKASRNPFKYNKKARAFAYNLVFWTLQLRSARFFNQIIVILMSYSHG